MDVTFAVQPGGANDVHRIMVHPHPTRNHGNPVLVGYCRPGSPKWSLIVEHDLQESHIAVVQAAVESHLQAAVQQAPAGGLVRDVGSDSGGSDEGGE